MLDLYRETKEKIKVKDEVCLCCRNQAVTRLSSVLVRKVSAK